MDNHRSQQQAKTTPLESEGSFHLLDVLFFLSPITHHEVGLFFMIFSPFLKFVACYLTEVSSTRWQFITMTAQEEDLIHRMHKLIGDR